MKYLLFDIHAVECIIGKTGFQSREYSLGNDLVDCITGKRTFQKIDDIFVKRIDDEGIIFAGRECDKKRIIVFDLIQSKLLEEQNLDDLLLLFQKSLRTAIRIWNVYPFSSSEYINGTKTIVFPFVKPDHRRIVIERSVKIERLKKRGIKWPLLVFYYGTEDAPNIEDDHFYSIMREAGEAYAEYFSEFRRLFLSENRNLDLVEHNDPLYITESSQNVSNKGFRYQPYMMQLSNLTISQKEVVSNHNVTSPIRIEGPAGTGKTASMVLRAYRLLCEAKEKNNPFRIVFLSHSESTNAESQYMFSLYDDAEYFLSSENIQSIQFSSLLQFCVNFLDMNSSEILENDAGEAKQFQRLYIVDSLDNIMSSKYRTYRPLLSDQMVHLFDNYNKEKDFIVSMLQHEFTVQIKGRTDSTLEQYYKLTPIKNGLPVERQKDKDFIYSIFKNYQYSLQNSSVYDCDDITIQALSHLNAPFWRRQRELNGYDYIFVDEMHLFNINEQYCFHYLTKSIDQKNIPICFALDYGQAIGDRGNVENDYIETEFFDVDCNQYKTVFRSSQGITDFCACISASGTLMFQNDYRNSYQTPISCFTQEEEEMCSTPTLYMYPDDDAMIDSIRGHIADIKRDTHCPSCDIAIITFEEDFLKKNNIKSFEEKIGEEVFVLKDRFSFSQSTEFNANNKIVFSSPYNVNGLEFSGVILVGVDDGRVPETKGVEDVSVNYIRFNSFNKLYLSSSRAKFSLIILGNTVHGNSPCLRYALESGHLIEKKPK